MNKSSRRIQDKACGLMSDSLPGKREEEKEVHFVVILQKNVPLFWCNLTFFKQKFQIDLIVIQKFLGYNDGVSRQTSH